MPWRLQRPCRPVVSSGSTTHPHGVRLGALSAPRRLATRRIARHSLVPAVLSPAWAVFYEMRDRPRMQRKTYSVHASRVYPPLGLISASGAEGSAGRRRSPVDSPRSFRMHLQSSSLLRRRRWKWLTRRERTFFSRCFEAAAKRRSATAIRVSWVPFAVSSGGWR
jgi:hypothetical protein